ncbi:pentapeptide repeat protein [Calothrix parasitica NIES-267]|uniref:Pentapeptide repeat protein n=1 Tax=Calothrix parasitica NIES-267 TaxID=1973488 RepID=A0A1Z4M0C8_9CYAN|nr:pentapeptide repeat protein [Calothrix parasitica NIES-267]
MINNNQNPREYDAVLGGNFPPPIDGVVLGGIEGLKRRLETGNTQQRVDSLADAVKYGDAGIDLLIEALNYADIEVRAKAFQILQDIDLEKVKQIVDKGILLRKGDKLYCVYASDIDYDDEVYSLIDSLEKTNDTCYDTEPKIIARYIYKYEAEAVAKDLHQTILRADKISEFSRQNNLHLNEIQIKHLTSIYDYADYYIYELDYHQGLANISNLNNFCIENNIPLKSKVGQEDEWDFKDRIFKHVTETKNYDKLFLFFDFLQIGKFAFVEEEIVNQDGYLNNGKV